jgi:hypothetical protein
LIKTTFYVLLTSNKVTNSSNHWSNNPPQACNHHTYQDMDQLITFNEAARFLKNPPTLAPCPDFAKNLSTLQTHKHSANAVCVPAEPDPRMGWTRNGAKYVRIAQSSAICHPHQSRGHAYLHVICHPISHENGRGNISAQQELIPVLQEHQPCMLQNVR